MEETTTLTEHPNGLANVPVEFLAVLIKNVKDLADEIEAMPAEERNRPNPKGSPLSEVAVMGRSIFLPTLEDELIRRGIDPADSMFDN